MYRSHWGLRESPFRSCLDPRFFFQSPTHEEALARLHFLVEERRRLGLLLGETGSGKSLTLEVFARELRRQGKQLANLNLLGVDQHELLWLLAAELGANPDRSDDTFRLWRCVTDRLKENRYQQLDTVFLLDDADEASGEVLDMIVRLAQNDSSDASRLTIVLAATSKRLLCLHMRLLELAELRIDLEPWEAIDTAGYLNRALAQAGRKGETFTDEATRRLHELCGGTPRKVTQLANLSLLAGAGRGLKCIDADTVESVYHELGVINAVA